MEYCGKIIWNRISKDLCFSYDDNGNFILDSMFMITSNNENQIKFLIGILNSSISKHWIKNNAATLGDGIYGAKIYIENLPIPKIDESKQNKIINLVDQILESKKSNIDTKDLESKVDELVYKLYNLRDKEIQIIEK